MFRPASIGAIPVVDLGGAWIPVVFNGHTEDQVRPVFQRRSPRGDYDSVTIDFDADWSLAAQSGISFGLAVDGTMTDGLPHHVVYSVAMSIHSLTSGSNAQAALNLRAYIGRYDSTILPSSPQTDISARQRLFLLPYKTHESHAGKQEGLAVAADRQFTTMSAEGQVLLVDKVNGDFSGLDQQRPLILVSSIFSPEANSVVTLKNISISMSLHKYTGDITTFSPTV